MATPPKRPYASDWVHPRGWVRCSKEQASTYEIISDISRPVIRFHPCGVTSPLADDVRNRFCAFCDRFIYEQHKETLGG